MGIKCLEGKCVAFLEVASFYQFDGDLYQAIEQIKPKLGDILAKKNIYNLSELFIIDEEPIKLVVNSDLHFLIPNHLVKKWGLFYWHAIVQKANLAEIYDPKIAETIKINLIEKKISIPELIQKYGIITVKKLVDIKIKRQSTGKICYEARTRKELLDIAKKKGIPIFNNITKKELIMRLRAK